MTKKKEQLKNEIKRRKQNRRDNEVADKAAKANAKELSTFFSKITDVLSTVQTAVQNVQNAIIEKQVEFPTVQKIGGEVKITNPDDMKTDVQKVKVENPIREVTIKNQIDFEPLRNDITMILKALDQVVQDEGMQNRNSLLELRDYLRDLRNDISKQDQGVIDALAPLQFLTNDPMKPLSVRLSDGEKFYKAMAHLAQQVTTAGGALGGTAADLSSILSLLQQIENNTDELELKADTINLNTDTLEALIASTNTLLTSIDANDFATESTLALIKACCDASKAVLDSIKTVLDSIDGKDFATETTLAALLVCCNKLDANTDELEGKLDTIISLLGGAAGGSFQEHAAITLGGSAQTDVVSFTVPAGKTACVKFAHVNGDADALFRLKKGATVKWQGTIDQFKSSDSAQQFIEGTAGTVFKITVEPEQSGASTRRFSAMINGSIL